MHQVDQFVVGQFGASLGQAPEAARAEPFPASLLGRSSVSLTHCTFVDMASGTGMFGPGTITITAANGHEQHLVHQGTFSLVMAPDGLTSVFDMTWVVAGGTGRFAGATGEGTTHGSSLLSTGTTSVSYEGEIAY